MKPRDAAKNPTMHRTDPPKRITCPQMSIVLRMEELGDHMVQPHTVRFKWFHERLGQLGLAKH